MLHTHTRQFRKHIYRALVLCFAGYFCVALLVHIFGAKVPIGNKIDPQIALATIKSLEKEAQPFRWKGTTTFDSLRDDSRGTYPYFQNYSYEVLYEPSSDRHWITVMCQGFSRANQGRLAVQFLSFDGEQYKSLFVLNPCEEGITGEIMRGTISRKREESSEHFGYWNDLVGPCISLGYFSGIPGICFVPRASTRSLSSLLEDWIEKGRLISITEIEEGVWDIVSKVTIWDIPRPNDAWTRIELRYDVNKGGVIIQQRIIAQQISLLPVIRVVDHVVMNWEITHELNSQNQWVPKSIIGTDRSVLGYSKIVFDEFEINTPLEEDSFSIIFPDGTHISDFITRMRYRIGKPIDEERAREDFKRRYESPPLAPVPGVPCC